MMKTTAPRQHLFIKLLLWTDNAELSRPWRLERIG
jgi:hypothetical protein